MSKRETEKERGVQIGISSLILVFTVLCLVVFATLSLASAKADYNLAEKNLKSTKVYYDMDGQAEEKKAEINRLLIGFVREGAGASEMKKELSVSFGENFDAEKNMIEYSIDGENGQQLVVNLKIFDYGDIKEGQENFEVQRWQIQNSEEYEIDESLSVWGGSLDE